MGFPLFVFVILGHTHTALHPFVISPAMELAPLLLGSVIRACSVFTEIFEFTCRGAVRVARLCGISIGRGAGKVAGALLVIVMFLFKSCGQINNNLILIGTLLVPLDNTLVVGVKVDHVANEGTGVESGVFFHTLAALALDVSEEIQSGISQISKDDLEELLLVVIDPVILEGTDFILHILNICEVGANVILAGLYVQFLYLPLIGMMVDY